MELGMFFSKKKLDHHRILRDVAQSMVRLRRPERLLRMITRLIDRELGLAHTSLLIRDEKKRRFEFIDSKGSRRLPVGLVKIELDHPLALWFHRNNVKNMSGQDYLYRSDIDRKEFHQRLARMGVHEVNGELEKIVKTMEDLKVELIVPGYDKKVLVGLLLLGKKSDGRKYHAEEIAFFQILAQDCSMAVKTAEYHRSLIEQNQELAKRLAAIQKLREKERGTNYQIMRALAEEVHAKDAYTFGHISQVERLGIMTAKEMGLDLSGRRSDNLSAGLILHDVGKIGIPDHILKKPAKLTQEEWKIMRTHVEKGAKILEPLENFKEVAEIVRCHHENCDGSGYPRGLKGEEIPIEARIVSVVDAFHAIVSTRCYSQGRPVEAAFEELKRCAGVQFDPVVVDAFVGALKKEMKKRGVGFFLDELTDGSRMGTSSRGNR